MSDEDEEPLSEHHRVYEDRDGMVELGELTQHAARLAWRRSLPTYGHAVRCLHLLADSLGDAVWEDPDRVGGRVSLHLREPGEPEWMVPSPVARLTPLGPAGDGRFTGPLIRNTGAVPPSDAPPGWTFDDEPYWDSDPEPDIPPAGEFARAGRIRFSEGSRYLELTFDDRGLPKESSATGGDSYWFSRHFTARPHAVDTLAIPPCSTPVSLLTGEGLAAGGMPLSEVVRRVAAMKGLELDPVRVRVPAPVPGGPDGVRARAMSGLRRALARGEAPAEACVACVDGFRGEVVAFGADAEEAVRAWEALVREREPTPPGWGEEPKPKDELKEARRRRRLAEDAGPRRIEGADGASVGFSTGAMTLRGGPGSETPWPVPVAENVPAARIAVPAAPGEIPEALAAAGFARWRRFLDPAVGWSWALEREDADGVTLIGGGIVHLVEDWEALEAAIAVAREAEREWMRSLGEGGPPCVWDQPEYPGVVEHWTIWDSARRAPLDAPKMGGLSGAATWALEALQPSRVQWTVTVASGPRR